MKTSKCQFFNKVFGQCAAFLPWIPYSAVGLPKQQLVTTKRVVALTQPLKTTCSG